MQQATANADTAAAASTDLKKQSRKVFVIKAGGAKVDEKCYSMAHVMCSMSASHGGCGAVFWAAQTEFRQGERILEVPAGSQTVSYGGWLTECPECGHPVGGFDVEFKMLSAPWLRKRFGVDIEENQNEYFATGAAAPATAATPETADKKHAEPATDASKA